MIRTYIIVRIGSNQRNQPLQQRMVIGSFATGKDDVVKEFRECNPHVTLYNNQSFMAFLYSKASKEDREASDIADALNY